MHATRLIAVLAAAALSAPAALAHSFDIEEAQADVARLIADEYEGETALPMPVMAVIERLEALGYTEIEEFDIDGDDEYEIEATAPGGEEVEIEMDALTGEILDVEED